MLINNKNITGLLLSLLILLFGTACSITPEVKSVPTLEKQTNSPEYVPITALELAQLKDAALQWQQARAGIERILKLEKEITYLVNHIDIINSKAIAQSSQPTSNSYSTRTIHNQQAARSRSQSVNQYRNKKQTVKLNTPRHIFALQVASVDSEKDIAKAWKELNTKAAPLFRKKILTNVETAKINKKTFYRLKLGSYQNLKNAKADCEVFKVYKLDCIVSNYTDKPVKL